MGFFARLKTGWALAMDSLDVLRRDPELMVSPFVGGIARTALYVYATEGIKPSQFDDVDFQTLR